jgi:hypothetical protein
MGHFVKWDGNPNGEKSAISKTIQKGTTNAAFLFGVYGMVAGLKVGPNDPSYGVAQPIVPVGSNSITWFQWIPSKSGNVMVEIRDSGNAVWDTFQLAISAQVTFQSRVYGLISTANKWRSDASGVLFWASRAVSNPGQSQYDDHALKLVDRCFKISSHPYISAKLMNIQKISSTFSLVGEFFEEVIKSKKYLTIPDGPKTSGGNIVGGEAVVGGWSTRESKGLTIYKNPCSNWKDDDVVDVIMHESVHYAGGIDHFITRNRGPAYGRIVFELKSSQAMINASSYSYLAWLARKHQSKWLNTF